VKSKIQLSTLVISMLAASATQAGSEAAIASAERAQQAAAAVGYEWRDTAKMIKDAQKLAAEGKTDEAITLANKAEREGKDALAQYHAEVERYQATH
jgi:hypothetical protein